MKFLLIFVLGAFILIGAIILNVIGSKVGVMSWYSFLNNPSAANLYSYVWLFFVYPFCLGLLGYIGFLFLKL